jgi:ubiquinone/menaquinone biosynthesis C-methylase UbiE
MREYRQVNATETDTRAQPQAGDGPSLPARAFDRLLRNNETFREQLQLTVHRMGLTGTGKRLLIIGAGSGAAVQGVPEEAPGWRVVAVDESDELTRHAQSEDWPPDYWFLTATLYNLGAVLARRNLPGPFDAVLVVYEMRHQRNLDDTLAYLRELLKPGAPLAVHEYSVRGNREARWTWATTCLAYLTRIRSHGRVPGMSEYLWSSVRRFDSVGEFRARLDRARFTDVRVQTFGGRMEHVLHTFLARAPVTRDSAPDDLGLPLTDTPRPGPGVRGRVRLPEPRDELLTHRPTAAVDLDSAATVDSSEMETPPQGMRVVDPVTEDLGEQARVEEPPRPQRSEVRVVEGPDELDPFDLDDDEDLPAEPAAAGSVVREGEESGAQSAGAQTPAREPAVEPPAVEPAAIRPASVRPESTEPAPVEPPAVQAPAVQAPAVQAPAAQPRPAAQPQRAAVQPGAAQPLAPEPPSPRPRGPERVEERVVEEPVAEIPPYTDAPERRSGLLNRFKRTPKAPRTASDGSWLTRAERETDEDQS